MIFFVTCIVNLIFCYWVWSGWTVTCSGTVNFYIITNDTESLLRKLQVCADVVTWCGCVWFLSFIFVHTVRR